MKTSQTNHVMVLFHGYDGMSITNTIIFGCVWPRAINNQIIPILMGKTMMNCALVSDKTMYVPLKREVALKVQTYPLQLDAW